MKKDILLIVVFCLSLFAIRDWTLSQRVQIPLSILAKNNFNKTKSFPLIKLGEKFTYKISSKRIFEGVIENKETINEAFVEKIANNQTRKIIFFDNNVVWEFDYKQNTIDFDLLNNDFDKLKIKLPLNVGNRFGSREMLERTDGLYSWVVSKKTKYSNQRNDKIRCYELKMTTQTYEETKTFCDGIGIVESKYKHFGTLEETVEILI